MNRSQLRIKVAAFFGLILIVDSFLYFRHAGHFFQGDTVFLLNHRATSLSGYLNEFVELNPSGWYRPLTNELFESLLFPIAGLNPIPYRIPVYVVFAAITVAVYALVLRLTRRHLAAGLAVFFFTIHTVNAYTTYDLGFMPELLFTLFYIAAVLAYLRYLEDGSNRAYWLSLACFVGSLLSKEAAVTLPATLFALSVIMGSHSRSLRERFIYAARSSVPHVVVLALYLAFAVGYLQIQEFSLARLFDPSQTPNQGDYIPVLNAGVFKNADIALSWAFNVPRGSWSNLHDLTPAMVGYLKSFRVLVFALAAVALVWFDRKPVLFGAAWFWITLAPALPLITHFVPYYLFLPVIGLSLIVGVVFARLYDWLRRFQPVLAAAVIVVLFAGVLFVTNRSIQGDIRSNNLLGGSATSAWSTLNDLKTMYPVLPPGVTLFFADAGQALAWQHDQGGLIDMAYGTRISTLYQSRGDTLFPDKDNVLAFDVQNGRLVDETRRYLSIPGKYMKFAESPLKLELSHSEVTAGRDTYSLRINTARNAVVRIAFTVNDGPLEIFAARLDDEGKASFYVSRNTKPGVYRFWGFKFPDQEAWIDAGRTLKVR